ncbi:unnamed protein product [Rhizoctonia solani]|uniref:Uncharacterized protein n=1 Tax=Rhizoctonia solani TaxID=456999 RepID=A0A8H3A8Q6_9AGAM|nr:unnamed protein product [Rhizoctonia solani]
MSSRSKKPSCRSQNALFRFVRRAAEYREAMPTFKLADVLAMLDDSKPEMDELELRASQLKAESQKIFQEIEAEYIAKGDIEGLEWHLYHRAQMEELTRLETDMELKRLTMEKELEALKQEIARLEVETAEEKAKTAEYRSMLRGETA